jgi:hypothetical protein
MESLKPRRISASLQVKSLAIDGLPKGFLHFRGRASFV